jgi:two-component system response regulator TctD
MRGTDGAEIQLSEREISILRLFAMHPGETLSRDFISARLWDDEDSRCENALTVAICRLREKLGPDGELLESRRGAGYIFRGRRPE